MIGLFAMQYYSATGGLSTVLWAATMTAVIVRLTMSDRENHKLLEEVRTDSLTGLGNRGRMEVELAETCERASDEQPAMLYLFDLNGFKRYNDTFGHPAGDRAPQPARQRAESGDRGRRLRLPDRRRRVLPAAHLRRGPLRGGGAAPRPKR